MHKHINVSKGENKKVSEVHHAKYHANLCVCCHSSMLHTAGVVDVSVKDVLCVLIEAMNEYVEGGTDRSSAQVIKWRADGTVRRGKMEDTSPGFMWSLISGT